MKNQPFIIYVQVGDQVDTNDSDNDFRDLCLEEVTHCWHKVWHNDLMFAAVRYKQTGFEVGQKHELKTWEEFFEQIWSGDKRFELRRNDRGFEVGDTLILREWDRQNERYTGRSIEALVTYILEGDNFANFGLMKGFCCMEIVVLSTTEIS